ncbi:MAG: tetratricopeptide repeat protein [Candidatus Eisenbacteria bacterium]|uniref:Tetratricopeptide repeat protein n=1 Tax=Eiseniibacteriota bacterium TaxID=2212470 RepID=A0A7Y2E522_UNCEI|nr:tetratricopeptide repeat protein [Candidatus Eisenbacteria bacterium]
MFMRLLGSQHALLALILSIFPAAALAQGNEASFTVEESVIDSTQIQILHFDGDLYMRDADFLSAIEVFKQAYFLDTENTQTQLLLARAMTEALLANQVPDNEIGILGAQALQLYRGILKSNPDHPEALANLRSLAQKFATDTPPFKNEATLMAWRMGEDAMAEQRFDDAVKAYREVLRKESDVRGAHRALADALRMNEQYDPALVMYKRSLELHPEDIRSLTGLGLIYLMQKKDDLALENLEKSFNLDRTYEPTAIALIQLLEGNADLGLENQELQGRCYVAIQSYVKGEKILENVVKEGGSFEGKKAIALAYYFQNKTTEALAYFRMANEENPTDVETQYYLGATYLRRGEARKGRYYLNSVLEEDPTNHNALKLMGLTLSDEPGREAESIALLTRAAELGASIEQMACIFGSLYMRIGEAELARKYFFSCIEESPNYAPAYLGLGILADDAGRKGEVVVHLERYLELEPKQPSALVRLGVAYLRLGKDDQGYDALRTLIEVDPTFAPQDGSEITDQHLLEMASFFLATVRSFDDAIFVGEKLLAMDPENSIYNNNLAMVYADADRDAERALELAEKANDLEPENLGHLDTLGWTLLRVGKYKDAETKFLQVIERTPESDRATLSEVYYHLGLLYQLMDRDDEARTFLTKALENPPTPFLRKEIRDLLEP